MEVTHRWWLVVETLPADRRLARDMVDAVLGPPGSLAWSLLPPPGPTGEIDTAAIPGDEDPSAVLVRIHLHPDVLVDTRALAELRARAEQFAATVGLVVTDLRAELT